MKLKLTMEMSNAAFDDGADGRMEAARILKSAVTWLEENSPTKFGLYDINGNRVGELKITGK